MYILAQKEKEQSVNTSTTWWNLKTHHSVKNTGHQRPGTVWFISRADRSTETKSRSALPGAGAGVTSSGQFLWGVMKMFQYWFGDGCSFVNVTRTPELYTLNGELLGMWTIPQQSYFSKGKAIPSYPGHLLVPRTPLGTGKCPRRVSCVQSLAVQNPVMINNSWY